ncbi:unnamed protein product, partial [Effrenium voratum]
GACSGRLRSVLLGDSLLEGLAVGSAGSHGDAHLPALRLGARGAYTGGAHRKRRCGECALLRWLRSG